MSNTRATLTAPDGTRYTGKILGGGRRKSGTRKMFFIFEIDEEKGGKHETG